MTRVFYQFFYNGAVLDLLKMHERKLNTFHHRCIRVILGISNQRQWSEQITMREVRRRWGDDDLAADKVKKGKLEWFGHVARMPDHRLPKSLLFGWLPWSCPRSGPRKRWRDVIRKDLKEPIFLRLSGIGKQGSPELGGGHCASMGWPTTAEAVAASSLGVCEVECVVCSRRFRRESDRKRHKCIEERQKPISEQRGAA